MDFISFAMLSTTALRRRSEALEREATGAGHSVILAKKLIAVAFAWNVLIHSSNATRIAAREVRLAFEELVDLVG
jgi:hypothetical protein